MINKITLKDNIIYKNQITINPHKLNFIYGNNGSGKTTFTNYIKDEFKSDKIEFDGENDKTLMVYNKAYVQNNFNEDNTISGVFTLGEESASIKNEIEILKNDLKLTQEQIKTYSKTYENKSTDLNDKSSSFTEHIWDAAKKPFYDRFPKLFEGIAKKKLFSEKILEKYSSFNIENMDKYKIEQIEQDYKSIFRDDIKKESIIKYKINSDKIGLIEHNNLFNTKIVGSEDNAFFDVISKLNNSDWVKKGLEYSQKDSNICPYCQQKITKDILDNITMYFDSEYTDKCESIDELYISYKQIYESIEENIKIIESKVSEYSIDLKIELNNLISAKQTILKIFEKNLLIIDKKIKSPSSIFQLNSSMDEINSINSMITSINEKIISHNIMIDKLEYSKNNCAMMFWSYIISENIDLIEKYKSSSVKLNKALTNINNNIIKNKNKEKEISNNIKELNRSLTSVQPTVDAINKILLSFGFTSFKLIQNPKDETTYKIVRHDSTEALDTLSEGEYTFITFLYFYHQIYGSKDPSGNNNEKIVVIDDPVSSLDSEILFIINHLTKNIINNCRDNTENISQIFILTHNLYFYKEVSFLGSREKYKENEVSYWVIRKQNDTSSISIEKENPISTTYEWLWDNIKNYENNKNNSSVFNDMRRILEHYFNIIGGLDYEKCIESFNDHDKLLCRSLLSLINDGSHTIFDDVIFPISNDMLNKYIRIFMLIFENTGHKSHYDMMMNKKK